MTPAEKRAQAESLMALARALLEEAAAEDAKGIAPMVSDDPGEASHARDRILDTTQARRMTKAENSSLYRWARRYGVGWKVAGQWRFSEIKLRALLAGERGEFGENGAGRPLPMANPCGQPSND